MGTKQRIEILTKKEKRKKQRIKKQRSTHSTMLFFFSLPVLYLGFELLNGFFYRKPMSA
jgi:hypothetical protein